MDIEWPARPGGLGWQGETVPSDGNRFGREVTRVASKQEVPGSRPRFAIAASFVLVGHHIFGYRYRGDFFTRPHDLWK